MKPEVLLAAARMTLACAALAAVSAGAQTTSQGAATAPGVPSAGGVAPLGSGSNGNAIIMISPAQPGGTNAMGAGAAAPRGPLSAVDIASMFLSADTNRDGDLSRAEAQRVPLPAPFEEVDTNNDGVISRFEFDEVIR